MTKQNDYIRWTDVLFIPIAMILSYILGQWLQGPLAIALSVVIVSLVFSLFGNREGSFKQFILAVLLGAVISYTLAALFGWPP
jgi:uncharacterized membrane protein YgaE (UPF0421/DUF939 family)